MCFIYYLLCFDKALLIVATSVLHILAIWETANPCFLSLKTFSISISVLVLLLATGLLSIIGSETSLVVSICLDLACSSSYFSLDTSLFRASIVFCKSFIISSGLSSFIVLLVSTKAIATS